MTNQLNGAYRPLSDIERGRWTADTTVYHQFSVLFRLKVLTAVQRTRAYWSIQDRLKTDWWRR